MLFRPEANTVGIDNLPYLGKAIFGEHEIRVFGTNEEPLFILVDICNALHISEYDMIELLGDEFDERFSTILLETGPNIKYQTLINEEHLKHMGMTVDKEFRVWIRNMLKQIRLNRQAEHKTFEEELIEIQSQLDSRRFSKSQP